MSEVGFGSSGCFARLALDVSQSHTWEESVADVQLPGPRCKCCRPLVCQHLGFHARRRQNGPWLVAIAFEARLPKRDCLLKCRRLENRSAMIQCQVEKNWFSCAPLRAL